MTAMIKYLKLLFHDAKKLAGEAGKLPGEENIHQLRVALKKIKAVHHLIQFGKKVIREKDLHAIRKLFNEAGKIREYQLLIPTVKNFESFVQDEAKTELIQQLDYQLQEMIDKFRHQYHHRSGHIVIKARVVFMNAAKQLPNPVFSSYFQFMLETISEKISHPSFSNEEYHLLRKLLKELKYNFTVANDNWKNIISDLFTTERITQLEEALGNWHDQVIIATRLKKIKAKCELSAAANELIQQVADAALSQSQFLLTEFKGMVSVHTAISSATNLTPT